MGLLVLKSITSLLLTLLPIAVLVRNWRFHDRRTKRHHRITRAIIVFWCAGSILVASFVWSDSARINELVEGKNTLIVQNRKLSAKLDKYQKDLNEREDKVKELEEKARKAERGVTVNYWFDGRVRRAHGGSITVGDTLANVFNQMKELEEQEKYPILRTICDEEISKNPEWATPYTYLGRANKQRTNKEQTTKTLEYINEIKPKVTSYGYGNYIQQY